MKSALCGLILAVTFMAGCGNAAQASHTTGVGDPAPRAGVAPTERDTLRHLEDSYWVVHDSSDFSNEFEPFVGFVRSETAADGLSLVGSDGCNGFGATLEQSKTGGYRIVNGHVTEVLCLDFENTGFIAAMIGPGPLGLELSADGESLSLARAGGVLLSRVDEDPRR